MPSSKYTYSCTFKHTLTGEKVNIDIDSTLPINKLKSHINSSILTNLHIQDDYVIIITGQKMGENANPIDLTSNDEFKALNCETFYIRPINTTTNSISQSNYVEFESILSPPLPPTSSPISQQISTNLIGNCNTCHLNFNLRTICPWSSCEHYQIYCETCLSDWFDRNAVAGKYPFCPSCGLDVLID